MAARLAALNARVRIATTWTDFHEAMCERLCIQSWVLYKARNQIQFMDSSLKRETVRMRRRFDRTAQHRVGGTIKLISDRRAIKDSVMRMLMHFEQLYSEVMHDDITKYDNRARQHGALPFTSQTVPRWVDTVATPTIDAQVTESPVTKVIDTEADDSEVLADSPRSPPPEPIENEVWADTPASPTPEGPDADEMAIELSQSPTRALGLSMWVTSNGDTPIQDSNPESLVELRASLENTLRQIFATHMTYTVDEQQLKKRREGMQLGLRLGSRILRRRIPTKPGK